MHHYSIVPVSYTHLDVYKRQTSNNATAAKEQQEALDAIAAAYGYEGSTNEFLNLYITSPTDTTQQLTMQQLLGNMRSGTGDRLLPADGSAITMEGRYFEGTTVVFNKDTCLLYTSRCV